MFAQSWSQGCPREYACRYVLVCTDSYIVIYRNIVIVCYSTCLCARYMLENWWAFIFSPFNTALGPSSERESPLTHITVLYCILTYLNVCFLNSQSLQKAAKWLTLLISALAKVSETWCKGQPWKVNWQKASARKCLSPSYRRLPWKQCVVLDHGAYWSLEQNTFCLAEVMPQWPWHCGGCWA